MVVGASLGSSLQHFEPQPEVSGAAGDAVEGVFEAAD